MTDWSKMNLEFLGGPHDGHSIRCLSMPPVCFFLPEEEDALSVSVYLFGSLVGDQLKYRFRGYQTITAQEAKQLNHFEEKT